MIYLSKFVAGKRMVMTYTSADFDRERAADYTLFIRVGVDDTAFAVVDGERRLKHISTGEASEDGLERTRLLELAFGQVKLAVQSNRYAFVPDEVFDEVNVPNYLRYLPDDGIADATVSTVTPLGIKLIHQTERLGIERFVERFPKMQIFPVIHVFLNSVADYGTHSAGPVWLLDKQSATVCIAFFNNGSFVYASDFDMLEMDDFVYSLLSVWEQVGLAGKTEKPKFLLSGDIVEDDEIHRWCSAQGSEVGFIKSETSMDVDIPDEITSHQHRYLTLLGLQLCE